MTKWRLLLSGVVLTVLLVFGLYPWLTNPGPKKPKIYDCFLFYNELELLELRLNELYDHVDKFVLVEAAETFKGKPKPFYYAQNRERFKKFSDKIIYVPIHQHYKTKNPWHREHFQRDQIIRGLKGCNKQDIIMVSDLDEIIRAERISEIAESLLANQAQIVVCEMHMYTGFMNRYQGPWPGTVAARYQDAKRLSTEGMRKLRNLEQRLLTRAKITSFVKVPNAGWHFTSLGGADRYIAKIESYSHSEMDTPAIKERAHIEQLIRWHPEVEVDDTFPRYMRDNLDHFRAIGFLE